MKINRERLQQFSVGDRRVKKKFALLPIYTEENRQGRWLEVVTVVQEVRMEMNIGSMDYGYHKAWRNIKFIEKEKNDEQTTI